jgi:hypothetical protein
MPFTKGEIQCANGGGIWTQIGQVVEILSLTNPARKGLPNAPVLPALRGKARSSEYYKGETDTKFGDWLMQVVHNKGWRH